MTTPDSPDLSRIINLRGQSMSSNEETERQHNLSSTRVRTMNSSQTPVRIESSLEATSCTQNSSEITDPLQEVTQEIIELKKCCETLNKRVTQDITQDIMNVTQDIIELKKCCETLNKSVPEDITEDIKDITEDIKDITQDIIKLKKQVLVAVIILAIISIVWLLVLTLKPIKQLKESSYPNVPIIDGIWSEWGDWSQCSATCGHGLQSRTRTCSDPEPSIGGKHCPGQNVEYRMCNFTTCTGDIVAFSWKFKIQNGALTFLQNDKIYTHGNGFTSATGIFTCSIPGIYLFSITLVKEESNSNLTCHLYKTEPYPSSKQLISLILNSSNFSSNSLSYASATVLVDLKVNDTMYLSGCYASSSSSKAYSVFSGVLLHKTI